MCRLEEDARLRRRGPGRNWAGAGGLRVVLLVVLPGMADAEGARWSWRAVRRRRLAMERSRPSFRLARGFPLRVMPAAAASARISLLIDVRDPGGRRAFCSRLVLRCRFRRWRMRVLYDRVAAIDVHKDMIKVAVRVPGKKRGSRTTDVLEFRTFYGVLQAMARELRRRGVTHVVMEASGVCTEPVYYALCEQDFTEVAVINPAHAKALKGHKTDAKDCARLAELFECGLLRGSYIPAAELKEVRDLTRYRMKTVQARTSEIQRLAKALETGHQARLGRL